MIFNAQTEWVKPTEFPDLRFCEEIAIDLETHDPELKTMGSGSVVGKGKVVGIAVAVDGYSGYFPFDHEGGGNLEKSKVIQWFTDICESPSDKVFHNAMYDVCWIRKMGIKINGNILNNCELQFYNEPARHKLLDVIGDLALIGKPIKGHIIAKKPGHKLNTSFAKILKEAMKEQVPNGDEMDRGHLHADGPLEVPAQEDSNTTQMRDSSVGERDKLTIVPYRYPHGHLEVAWHWGQLG